MDQAVNNGSPGAATPADWTFPGAFEVAPGVHRIPLPLPNDALRAVNVYAIADRDGLILIDSGWALALARQWLESALAGLGHALGDITRFLMTHVHRDHYTQAVLLRRNGADGIAGRLERSMTRTAPEMPWELPDEWLAPGDIPLAARTLHAIATPGHTRGHLCYRDAVGGLLFSGDHILPHITPSIGFEAATAALPLGDYLQSLRLIRGQPDAAMLPAHGPPGASVHARVDELLAHHAARLNATEQATGSGAATAYEAAGMLTWTRRERKLAGLDIFNQMLAVLETAAHLDVLVMQGRLRAMVSDGTTRYVPR